MNNLTLRTVALAIVLASAPSSTDAQITFAHGGGHSHPNHPGQPNLHVNHSWKECSFQLDSALTQGAWKQFTREAGLVVYFRSLATAQPLGKGRFEFSMLQWGSAIDDGDAAWNDTFVHPDSAHYLKSGSRLAFPGLMVRAGLTDKTDAGVYFTKNPDANYGFFGAQLQQNLASSAGWAASVRTSFVSMFGPDDLDFTVYGAELVGSRTRQIGNQAAVSLYAGTSAYFARSHEKSAVVDLEDEGVLGAQGMLGAELKLFRVRFAAEYNAAKVQTLSFKVGLGA